MRTLSNQARSAPAPPRRSEGPFSLPPPKYGRGGGGQQLQSPSVLSEKRQQQACQLYCSKSIRLQDLTIVSQILT